MPRIAVCRRSYANAFDPLGAGGHASLAVPADAGANWSFGAVHPPAAPMHAHRGAHEPLGDFAHAHLHGAMADELGPAGGAAGPSSIWSRPPMMGPALGFSGGMQPLPGAQAGQVVRVEWYSAAEREVRPCACGR